MSSGERALEKNEPGQKAADGSDTLGGRRAAALHSAHWEDGFSSDKR